LPEESATRVRGVLALYDASTGAAYLQDGASGLFVEVTGAPSVPAPGREVEAVGVMRRRGPAAYLSARAFRMVPAGAPTPEPKRIAAAALVDRDLEGTWVAAEGDVLRVTEVGP